MPFTGNLLQVFCIIIFWPLFAELPYSRRNTIFHRDAATIKRYVTVHSSVVECCGDVWGSIFKHATFLFRHRHMKENLAPRSTVRWPCNCRFRVLSCLFLAIKRASPLSSSSPKWRPLRQFATSHSPRWKSLLGILQDIEGWYNLLCFMIGQLSSYTAVGHLSDLAAGVASEASSPEFALANVAFLLFWFDLLKSFQS